MDKKIYSENELKIAVSEAVEEVIEKIDLILNMGQYRQGLVELKDSLKTLKLKVKKEK